jgi:hypothetical protein
MGAVRSELRLGSTSCREFFNIINYFAGIKELL